MKCMQRNIFFFLILDSIPPRSFWWYTLREAIILPLVSEVSCHALPLCLSTLLISLSYFKVAFICGQLSNSQLLSEKVWPLRVTRLIYVPVTEQQPAGVTRCISVCTWQTSNYQSAQRNKLRSTAQGSYCYTHKYPNSHSSMVPWTQRIPHYLKVLLLTS